MAGAPRLSGMPRRSVTVRVPATSANLGPGFDSLGVALDWTADVTVTVDDEPLRSPDGPIESMAASAALALFHYAGQVPRALTAEYRGDIPVGRGLGVSAVARAAGLLAADALLGGGHAIEELIPIAVNLEGHGDNIVPALLGGLQVVVHEEDDRIAHTGLEPPANLRLALLIPDFSMPTHESRQRLPASLTRNQAVHNIGRAAMLVAALTTGRYELLNIATEDILHQPARATIFPAMYPIFQAARDAGAYGVYLSGGGSGIAAFTGEENAEDVAGSMREAASARGLAAEARVCAMSSTGAHVLEAPVESRAEEARRGGQ
jgi:homoserine kinase